MVGCCRRVREVPSIPFLRLVVSSLEPLPDDELVAEREMLEYARRCLAAMRRRTRSLEGHRGRPVCGGVGGVAAAAAGRRPQ